MSTNSVSKLALLQTWQSRVFHAVLTRVTSIVNRRCEDFDVLRNNEGKAGLTLLVRVGKLVSRFSTTYKKSIICMFTISCLF